jgi:4-aminobutyrate aminotransferase-like enzyme/Ser/Thr protein kinase RdoA (MazF antagonist)
MKQNSEFNQEDICDLLKSNYQIESESVKKLPGDVDLNFFIRSTDRKEFIFKISHEKEHLNNLMFQTELLNYLNKNASDLILPKIINTVNNNTIHTIKDASDNKRYIRLLTWVQGRLFSTVNPKTDRLRYSLGQNCAKMIKSLEGFDHSFAHRDFIWDLAQWEWTKEYLNLFNKNDQETILFFHDKFEGIKSTFLDLRKSVIHNDANDNNVLVSSDLKDPEVLSIIDYGDAIYSQTINDVAVTSAYALMSLNDPLSALKTIVSGYHSVYPLLEDEINCLYTLVAIRLIISVTKAAINKKENPENEYLQISVNAAWDLLRKWEAISEAFVKYSLKSVCGFELVSNKDEYLHFFKKTQFSFSLLIPKAKFTKTSFIDMSISSPFLGNFAEYNDLKESILKMDYLKAKNPETLFVGGYLEFRPFYSTDSFKKLRNNGIEYRTAHLGIDIWADAGTAIHSPLDGTVSLLTNNSNDGDYGPTVIMNYEISKTTSFYILYGHLDNEVLVRLRLGEKIKKNELIAYIGNESENGKWVPHLHFQIIFDMMEYGENFPGVSAPSELDIYAALSPDPNLLFKDPALEKNECITDKELLDYRKEHLGKGLSLSYQKPLSILRGEMQYLIDSKGQKYLDTVNNVAHVGHENPRVVATAQKEIAILNTNTRYLNKNMVQYSKELLSTFPKELSVVHFVNSGSEANELAMRMAACFTGQKDMIAVEHGYHGNTAACINVSSYKFDGKGGSGAPEFTHIVPLPDSLRGIYKGKSVGKKYADHVQEQVKKVKSLGRNVSAFISEVIISCGGQIELPEDYLTIAYKYIREAGAVCIADEVQHGFGRVGKAFWAFQMHGVVPDIVTMGKPIGNGHPMAAVVCKQEIAESFANGMEFFNTFGGNPVSMAIGKEVLSIIKDENLQKHAKNIGDYFKEELKKIQKNYSIIADVRGQGLFLGIEFLDEDLNPLADKVDYLINQMKDRKILLSSDGPDHNVIKIKPPMCFTKDNAIAFLENFEEILNHDFMTS